MTAPARLPGKWLIGVGAVLDAVLVAVYWGSGGGAVGLSDGDPLVSVGTLLFSASLAVVIGGAAAVVAGFSERGGLLAAAGSILLLPVGVVSLYGGLMVRSAAARRRLTPVEEQPDSCVTLTKRAQHSQALGGVLVVVGIVLAVAGGPGGILLGVGLVLFAEGHYAERAAGLCFYSDRLVWTVGLVQRPVAIRYADVLDIQEEERAILIVAADQTVRVPSDAVPPRAYADLAGRLLRLRPTARM